jgi:hypothetical protein
MMMFNLVNIISKTTRITDHSNTLLDPIIISDTINYIYSDVLKEQSEISNHAVLLLAIDKSELKSPKITILLYHPYCMI